MRISRLALLSLLAIALLTLLRHWADAPPVVPSHFDFAGRPDSFAGKDFVFTLQALIFLLVGALGLGMEGMLRRSGDARINLPNKEYWLAPERRDQTIERIAVHLEVFLAATLVLVFCGFQLGWAAVHRPGNTFASDTFAVMLAAYFAFVGGWLVRLLSAFRIPGPQ